MEPSPRPKSPRAGSLTYRIRPSGDTISMGCGPAASAASWAARSIRAPSPPGASWSAMIATRACRDGMLRQLPEHPVLEVGRGEQIAMRRHHLGPPEHEDAAVAERELEVAQDPLLRLRGQVHQGVAAHQQVEARDRRVGDQVVDARRSPCGAGPCGRRGARPAARSSARADRRGPTPSPWARRRPGGPRRAPPRRRRWRRSSRARGRRPRRARPPAPWRASRPPGRSRSRRSRRGSARRRPCPRGGPARRSRGGAPTPAGRGRTP